MMNSLECGGQRLYEKVSHLCVRLSNDVKWWHCDDILNTKVKSQRHWHCNALQNTFLAIMSCPKLSNRRRDCDQISHLVRCWIVDTNLGCPHWICVEGVSIRTGPPYIEYTRILLSVECRKWLYREYSSIHSIGTQLLLVAGTELQVFLTLSLLSAQRDKTNAPSYVHHILSCVPVIRPAACSSRDLR